MDAEFLASVYDMPLIDALTTVLQSSNLPPMSSTNELFHDSVAVMMEDVCKSQSIDELGLKHARTDEALPRLQQKSPSVFF